MHSGNGEEKEVYRVHILQADPDEGRLALVLHGKNGAGPERLSAVHGEKKMKSNRIVGAGDNRRDRDYYPTPSEVTQALIDYLQIPKGSRIWECACGQGHMEKVLQENGYEVIATDILYGDDFLTTQRSCDWIITNPPFKQAEQFIHRALEFGVPFAFLLKSQYWHSKNRLKLFQEHPPYAVLPLTWRPDFTGGGQACWICAG